MRKTRPPYRPKSRWFVVERWMSCVGAPKGPGRAEVRAHDVRVGTWMRWTKRDDRTATCEQCLALQGVHRSGGAHADPSV